MKKKLILAFGVLLVIVSIAGVIYFAIKLFDSEESPSSSPIPSEPVIISQPAGNFDCDEMYDEIESDLARANYCEGDHDCSVIILGGWYIEFGCYHFINAEVDQQQFFDKMEVYKKKCSEAINECAPAPKAKCINNKCEYVEE